MATMRGAKRGGGTKSQKPQKTAVFKAPPSTIRTLDKMAKPKTHLKKDPSKKKVVEKASGRRKASKKLGKVAASKVADSKGSTFEMAAGKLRALNKRASAAASKVKAIEKSAMAEIERQKGAVVTLRKETVVVTLRRGRRPDNDDTGRYDICDAPPGKDDTNGYD